MDANFFPDFQRIFPDFLGFYRFSGILPGFSTNQNVWRCAYAPASYTTVFYDHNLGKTIICWEDDRMLALPGLSPTRCTPSSKNGVSLPKQPVHVCKLFRYHLIYAS